MGPSTEANVQFDIRGPICPSALWIALKEVNSRKEELRNSGLCLSIRTDNRDSTVTIPEALTKMGYSVAVSKVDRHYLVEIHYTAHPE